MARNGMKFDRSRVEDTYWIPILSKALDVLECFEDSTGELTLKEITRRTRMPHTTAYRILHTLTMRGYLQQSTTGYRLSRVRRKLRIGFANLSKYIALAVEIQSALEAACATRGVELLTWDNDRDAERTLQNAEAMVDSHLDIAIEFQLHEQSAPVVADIFSRAGLPLISIVNPHHGTIYFGVDNYRAGFTAGKALADFAAQRWRRPPDRVLLLDSPRAGRTVHSRMVGVVRGIAHSIGALPESAVHYLDGGGERCTSSKAVTQFLARRQATRVLIAGINDESAIGAEEAVAGTGIECLIVGHGGSAELLELAAKPTSPCIGTVSFHPELYGLGLMEFALAMLQGKPVPPVQYVPHEFLGKKIPNVRNKKSEREPQP